MALAFSLQPGFGVHTYKLLTREGRETFVKFHWIPKCGECPSSPCMRLQTERMCVYSIGVEIGIC